MKRLIINHWTAGKFTPSKTDFEHYHYLIDFGGKVYRGIYPVIANDNCNDGNYAAHTGGMNTNTIGIALCGMAGFVSPEKAGNYKLTKIQVEKLFELNAKLLKNEGWRRVTEENLLTHYEISQKVLKGEIQRTPLTAQNIGKIDIVYLPPYPKIKTEEIGDFIRNKSQWYFEKL